jgi:hypothetical protein
MRQTFYQLAVILNAVKDLIKFERLSYKRLVRAW